MTKIIDLHPNKKLINSSFEKYQFCSDVILTKYEKELQTEILCLNSTTSQDSWLEARLFAFHNHLFKNPYESTCWFVDKNGGIWKFESNGSLGLVYTSNSMSLNSCNFTYNPSIAFASKDIFIVCNGGGTLEFLIELDGFIKKFFIIDIEPAVILDARFIKETSEIIVAIYKIDENEGRKFSKLIFLFYNYNKDSIQSQLVIKLINKQVMKVKGAIEHVYIEENGKFCHIISQDQVEFECDSQSTVKFKDDNKINDFQINIPQYCWSQDVDSITVYVKVPEKYDKLTAKVEVMSTSVSITVGDVILLSGKTPNKLEPQLTTWKHKGDTLEVELYKYESGLMWNELMKGDTGGEYLPNEALAAEIHSRLSHLCSNQQEVNVQSQPTIGFNSEQLEECDLSGSENILQRINFNSHGITHMAMLGTSNRVLFVEKQSSGQIICLRHDHDGCIWIIKESNLEDWNLEHTHTFPGFGYVEASKTNKKFCISPPDGSFIAIVEHTKHAFLYEKPQDNAQIGRQRILDFGNQISSILGAAAINKYLIILTKNALYQMQIYS